MPESITYVDLTEPKDSAMIFMEKKKDVIIFLICEDCKQILFVFEHEKN